MSTGQIEITSELKDLLDYVQTEVVPRYPNTTPDAPHFLLAVLDNSSCMAHGFLTDVVLGGDASDFREYCHATLESLNSTINVGSPDTCIDKFITYAEQMMRSLDFGSQPSSLHTVIYLLTHDKWIADFLSNKGVTMDVLTSRFEERTRENELRLPVVHKESDKPTRRARKKRKPTTTSNLVSGVEIIDMTQAQGDDLFGSCTIPLFLQANQGELDPFVEDASLYSQMFNILARRTKNNVLIVGDHGVGKTAFSRHLAVKILEGTVPSSLQDKKLIELDFNKLVAGTSLRGAFEQKIDELTTYFHSHSDYLLFIDDLGEIIKSMNKNNQADIEPVIKGFLTEPRVGVICTTSHQSYKSKIADSPLARYFQVITLEAPSAEMTTSILNIAKGALESYHGVAYDDAIVHQAPRLAEKYILDRALPDSAIDLLDEMGAMKHNQSRCPAEAVALRNDLEAVEEALAETPVDYDERDELLRECAKIKSQLAVLEKRHKQTRTPDCVTMDDLLALVSLKTGVPITSVSAEERVSLKGLEDRLKSDVIGQDKAVGEVSRAIKRKRVGLANTNKPSVLFFGGSTGTGKTYLAKMLAKHVFGDEKKIVRVDMSEYGDKTSVNKILGASAGYVGYENGSVLLDAVRKNKYCVVLLDEIEKADEQVHNTLLQIFDDGRMTDNHGNLVDFRHAIIIMTSNVGAKAIAERGAAVGFAASDADYSEEIIKKELKRTFKPEFLNRIDEIIYFNKLSDSDLKSIIKCELRKIDLRLQESGMAFGSDMYDADTIDFLFDRLDHTKDMGARPIMRMLQRNVEDAIADQIVESEVEAGHMFSRAEVGIGNAYPPVSDD